MKRIFEEQAFDYLRAESALADPLFSEQVICWQKQSGRHTLPWQNTQDAYRIWLSEIMLQQTQVTAVIPYYQRFLLRFPDVVSLAQAPAEEVMAHWSGLGYYSRARNLHQCAKAVVTQFGGIFPGDPALLAELPGIGRSTAAAIAAFSYGARAAILDGNVKRVFARVFGIDGYPGEKAIEARLWQRAEALLPLREIEAYTQGLMDLGATICTRSKPACSACPLASCCVALATDRVDILPIRKPKKSIPDKYTAMLVVVDGDHVLLEQRPNRGIWGGLLSLPEIDAVSTSEGSQQQEKTLETAIERGIVPFGVLSSWDRLQPFSHVFTHFRLHVSPYRVHLQQRINLAEGSSYVWYATERLTAAPLPAPVKKMLLALCHSQDLLSGNE